MVRRDTREKDMPRLTCPHCGLSYDSTTLPQYLLSPRAASCPHCAAPLTKASPDPDPDRRPRLGSTPERHRAAVQRTLGWADQAAADGDYAAALAWLATIEAIDGELPPGAGEKRRAWAATAHAAAADR